MPTEVTESQDIKDSLGSHNFHEHLTSSSGLFQRPRARSDHARRTAISEVRSRTSIDTIIGNHDSVVFASATPIIARRYRATSVDIQSHGEKYQPLRHQPSVVDDLTDYVLPNMGVGSRPSEEWATSSTQSVPSALSNDNLQIDHVFSNVQETMATPDMVAEPALRSMNKYRHDQDTLKELSQDFEEPDPTQQRSSSNIFTSNHKSKNTEPRQMYGTGAISTSKTPSHCSSLASISHSSLSSFTLASFQDEGPVFRPSSQRPSQRKSRKIPNTPRSRSDSTITSSTTEATVEPGPQLPAECTEKAPHFPPPPMIVIDDACQPILANETEIPEDAHDGGAVLSAFRQKLQGEVDTRSTAEGSTWHSSIEPANQSIVTEQPIFAPPTPKNPDAPSGELKPITVLAATSPAMTVQNGLSPSKSNESQEDLSGKSTLR